MIRIKRNLILSLEKRKKEGNLITENIPIRLRINYDGIRVDLQTGYRIDLIKWDNSKEQVKNGAFNKYGEDSTSINLGLTKIASKIQELFRDCETQERIPSKQEILSLVKEIKSKGNTDIDQNYKNNLFQIFDTFTKENGKLNNWTDATYSKFSTVKNHLTDFKADLTFEDFDKNGLTDYLVFLASNKKMVNSTVKKYLGFLKWFLKWGYENNKHTNDSFKKFNPKIKTTTNQVIFLTQEEKKKIIELEIPESKQYLHRVRDVLLFLCYSGLRHSDIYNLKRNDIKDNHINIKADHIEVTTIKTNDNLIIELNKHTKAILNKYKDIPYKNNKALPVVTNQKMNEYLKELGELAEVNTPIRQTYYIGNKRVDEIFPKYQLLSTHVGRKTFISTCLSLGVPAQVIMQWTGHKSYSAMKPYIGIEDKTRQNEMSKLDML